MKKDEHGDLVSTAAIIAGTSVSIVVTIVSFLLSGESAPPEVTGPGFAAVSAPTYTAGRRIGAVEWRALEAYAPIQWMTHEDVGSDEEAVAISELTDLARAYPADPFVQELLLKGIRVSQYWAHAASQPERAAMRSAHFEMTAARTMRGELTAREIMRMAVQRVRQDCLDLTQREASLLQLSALYPTQATEAILYDGRRAISTCLEREGR